MKNLKLLGIIAMIAVIGFSMAGCGDDDDGGGDEEEKDGVGLAFDSALYGVWNKEGTEERSVQFTKIDTSYGDPILDADAVSFDYGGRLLAKNGNTYTVTGPYLDGEDTVFTAVVGSDGKLTISGLTASMGTVGLTRYNGTYTKDPRF